jgi:hypothetical protein
MNLLKAREEAKKREEEALRARRERSDALWPEALRDPAAFWSVALGEGGRETQTGRLARELPLTAARALLLAADPPPGGRSAEESAAIVLRTEQAGRALSWENAPFRAWLSLPAWEAADREELGPETAFQAEEALLELITGGLDAARGIRMDRLLDRGGLSAEERALEAWSRTTALAAWPALGSRGGPLREKSDARWRAVQAAGRAESDPELAEAAFALFGAREAAADALADTLAERAGEDRARHRAERLDSAAQAARVSWAGSSGATQRALAVIIVADAIRRDGRDPKDWMMGLGLCVSWVEPKKRRAAMSALAKASEQMGLPDWRRSRLFWSLAARSWSISSLEEALWLTERAGARGVSAWETGCGRAPKACAPAPWEQAGEKGASFERGLSGNPPDPREGGMLGNWAPYWGHAQALEPARERILEAIVEAMRPQEPRRGALGEEMLREIIGACAARGLRGWTARSEGSKAAAQGMRSNEELVLIALAERAAAEGVDPDTSWAREANGASALMAAAHAGFDGLFLTLLKNGADPAKRDLAGRDALQIAQASAAAAGSQTWTERIRGLIERRELGALWGEAEKSARDPLARRL